MDIRCNSCNTEYEFDEAQIPPEGVRVKCEVCQNIFQVLPPEPDGAEEQQVFMIRQTDGNVLEFTELETLHEWILEGVVVADDEISSTGDSWAKLRHLPELEEVFAQAPAQKRPVSQVQPTRMLDGGDQEPTGRISPSFEELHADGDRDPSGILEPLYADESDQEPDFDNDLLSSDMNDMYDEHFSGHPRAKWPWVLGLFILVLGGSLGGLLYLEVITNPFARGSKGGGITPEPSTPDDGRYIRNAKTLLKGGTRQAFREALHSLKGCPSPDCFAIKAYLRSMIGFTYFMELKLGDFAVKGLPKDSRKVSDWIVQRSAFEKGIRDECLEAGALAETALQMGAKDPAGVAAVHMIQLLKGERVDARKLDRLVKEQRHDAFIAFLDLFRQVSGKADASKAIRQLLATPSGALLEIPLLKLLALNSIQHDNATETASVLAVICRKRPALKSYCAASTLAVVPVKNPIDDPMKSATPAVMKPEHVTAGMAGHEEKGDYDSFFMKAEQAYKLGDKAKAKAYYLKAAAKDATSADPLNGVGWCNLDTGNYSGAVTFFKKALALVPYYGRARYGLAEAYARAGNDARALAEYKNYLARHGAARHAARVRLEVQRLEKKLKKDEVPAPMVIIIPMTAEPAMPVDMPPPAMTTPVKDMVATPPAMTPPVKTAPMTPPMAPPAKSDGMAVEKKPAP